MLGVDVGSLEAQMGNTSVSVSGFDGSDGKITLVLGLLAIAGGVVLAMRRNRRVGATLAIAGGALGTLLALYDMTKAKDDALGDATAQFATLGLGVPFDEIFKVSIGIGLWVCLLGGIVALVGGGLSFRGKATAGGAVQAPGTSTGVRSESGWGGGVTPPAPSMPPPTGAPPEQPPMGGTAREMPTTPESGAPDDAPS